MLTVSNLKRVRYFPELIPDGTFYQALAAGTTASPPPLDMRRLSLATEIEGLRVTPHADLELEFRVDRSVREIIRTGLLTGTDYHPFRFAGADTLALDVRNMGSGDLANVRVEYGLWVWEPTTADKLLRGWSLDDVDRRAIAEVGIQDTVEKGILPLPRSYMLQREYQLIRKMVYPVPGVSVAADAEPQLILNVSPAQDVGYQEFLVLEQFSCSNTTAGIVMVIERDEDPRYITYETRGMFGPVKVWIPALHELRIYLESPNAANNVNFAFTIGRYRMNNVLRARWGLASEADLPKDLWLKVAAGIL